MRNVTEEEAPLFPSPAAYCRLPSQLIVASLKVHEEFTKAMSHGHMLILRARFEK